jgi:hypothetical protein
MDVEIEIEEMFNLIDPIFESPENYDSQEMLEAIKEVRSILLGFMR